MEGRTLKQNANQVPVTGGDDQQPSIPEPPSLDRREADATTKRAIYAAEIRREKNTTALAKVIALLEEKDIFLDKEEDKSEEQRTQEMRKIFSQWRVTLTQKLKTLHEETASQAEEKAEGQTAAKAARDLVAYEKGTQIREALRTLINGQILEAEIAETKAFCDKAFQVLQTLTMGWPVNEFSDENDDTRGQPIDFIRLTPIDDDDAVVLGYQVFDKRALIEYFQRNNAYRVKPGDQGIEIVDSNHKVLTAREIAYLDKEHILPPRNAELRNAVQLGHIMGESGVQVQGAMGEAAVISHFVTVLRNLVRDRSLSFFMRFPYFSAGAAAGGMLSLFLGVIFSVVLLTVLLCVGVTQVGLPAIVAAGLLCGFIEYKRQGGNAFWEGLVAGGMGASIVFLLAYLGPVLIAALGSASLISSASVAVATALWTTLIQPLVPAVVTLFSAVGEYFRPGFMRKSWDWLYIASLAVPTFLITAVGALAGGCGASFTAGLLRGLGCWRGIESWEPNAGAGLNGQDNSLHAGAGLNGQDNILQEPRVDHTQIQRMLNSLEPNPGTGSQCVADLEAAQGQGVPMANPGDEEDPQMQAFLLSQYSGSLYHHPTTPPTLPVIQSSQENLSPHFK